MRTGEATDGHLSLRNSLTFNKCLMEHGISLFVVVNIALGVCICFGWASQMLCMDDTINNKLWNAVTTPNSFSKIFTVVLLFITLYCNYKHRNFFLETSGQYGLFGYFICILSLILVIVTELCYVIKYTGNIYYSYGLLSYSIVNAIYFVVSLVYMSTLIKRVEFGEVWSVSACNCASISVTIVIQLTHALCVLVHNDIKGVSKFTNTSITSYPKNNLSSTTYIDRILDNIGFYSPVFLIAFDLSYVVSFVNLFGLHFNHMKAFHVSNNLDNEFDNIQSKIQIPLTSYLFYFVVGMVLMFNFVLQMIVSDMYLYALYAINIVSDVMSIFLSVYVLTIIIPWKCYMIRKYYFHQILLCLGLFGQLLHGLAYIVKSIAIDHLKRRLNQVDLIEQIVDMIQSIFQFILLSLLTERSWAIKTVPRKKRFSAAILFVIVFNIASVIRYYDRKYHVQIEEHDARIVLFVELVLEFSKTFCILQRLHSFVFFIVFLTFMATGKRND